MNKCECPLCGGVASLKTDKQKGYCFPDLFMVFHCSVCNTSFSSPYPSYTPDLYENIYNSAKDVPGYDRYYRYYDEIQKANDPIAYLSEQEPSYWGLFSTLKKLNISSNASLLEIGSGLGYTTYALQRMGFKNAKGLDISKEAVVNSCQKFGDYYFCADINEYSNENEELYDVIFFTEVIEHIKDPITFIGSALRLLKQDGILIVTTPNKSFYPNDAIWITENPPIHCWWFSEDSFKYIANITKTKISFVNFSEYYKKHERIFYNKSTLKKYNMNEPFFDSKGKLLYDTTVKIEEKKAGIFPAFVKRTTIYKKVSRSLYPIFFKSFVSSAEKTDIMCVILKKK